MIVDPDLPLLQYKTAVLDKVLDDLEHEATISPDPDSFGVYDAIDDISGFGFVACQKYIRATFNRLASREKPLAALALGPKHERGQHLARLIWECANYWKHCDEWRPEDLIRRNSRPRETLKCIETLGVNVCHEYQVAKALREAVKPKPPRLASLLPLLIQWRDEVMHQEGTRVRRV